MTTEEMQETASGLTPEGHPLHKVLSFVRRSGRLDARLQRALDNYAGDYLLNIGAGNGLLDVREDFVLDRAFVEGAWAMIIH